MRIEDVWQDWKVEKKIGRGSYGTVYKCFKEENGERKYSAIKVISVPGDDIELQSSGSLEHMTAEQSKTYYKEIIDGFMRETAILESLEGHPNIVRIDDSIIVEISMLPGKIKIHGFKPSGEPKLVLTQKIAKEKAE